jgi:hypothetical protein
MNAYRGKWGVFWANFGAARPTKITPKIALFKKRRCHSRALALETILWL